MPHARDSKPSVSIVIPVFEQLAFTRQCLDRIERHASGQIPVEIIVVDNGSADGTREYFESDASRRLPLKYLRQERNLGYARANNIGAALSTSTYLLLLNNDTLVQPGWLDEMVALAQSDPAVGIVGIKQLFPYTNRIHHTGIVFTTGGRPVHLHPNADASLPYASRQRDYQAVNGACLLIERELYLDCGGLNEAYRNGFEDIDLCLKVGQRGRRIVCCTSAFIYHYGQTSITRADDDRENEALFLSRWRARVAIDEPDFLRRDSRDARTPAAVVPARSRAAVHLPDAAVYFADSMARPSALTWFNIELALALRRRGIAVHLAPGAIAPGPEPGARRTLEQMRLGAPPVGGVQIKWSHYWPEHLNLELAGCLNLELFVINYCFPRPGAEPWDRWLQCVAGNGSIKLALSTFSRDVLRQVGVADTDCFVLHPGYAVEIGHSRAAQAKRSHRFRFLTLTNSHDLERYGTVDLIDAYWQTFRADEPVVLVVRDYGVSSGSTTLADALAGRSGRAAVELQATFTPKAELIELYRSCDAMVSAHRGEGFAMKLLDAMACGLPVVTPLFGGPADYCTPENCFPVDFLLAPMGDCLDSRALRITNGPAWAAPDSGSLGRQMRRVFDEPAAARAVGERGRRDVADAFTWDRTAQALIDIVAHVRRTAVRASPALVRSDAPPTSRSPYWGGVRVSIVIPTFNRRDQLMRSLAALEAQSILTSEFEVIVVDDGSTDGTADAVAARAFPFSLRVHRQPNLGPGEARNAGVALAHGELVLFLGDDIVAQARLLEGHLLAHAANPQPGYAVLGHVDWPDDPPPTPVMQYVSGPGNRQFAYDVIPSMPALDFRFFYTSNVSLKRQFLLDAAADGVAFDRVFTFAAYEDTELAYRLARRGLQIVYAADARARHEHRMDVHSFSAREFRVGQMGVALYRRHPQLDALVDVGWLGDADVTLKPFLADPSVLDRMRRIDEQTDRLLLSLATTLDEQLATAPARAVDAASGSQLTFNRVLDVMFDAERTRGKVTEWYANVSDPASVDAARTVLTTLRKLERLETRWAGASRRELSLAGDPALQDEVRAVEQQLGTPLVRVPGRSAALRAGAVGLLRRVLLRRTVFLQLRALDARLVQRLRGRPGPWLSGYMRARNRVRRLLF